MAPQRIEILKIIACAVVPYAASSLRHIQRQGNRSQDAGVVSELGRDDVLIDAVDHVSRADVTVQQLQRLAPDQGEEAWLPHDAAAEDNPLRRQRANEVGHTEREVMRLQLPSLMVQRETPTITSPASVEGGARRQTLPAVAVKRTSSREGVRPPFVRNAHMTHFRVQQAVHQAPFHHSAAANSGTYSDVDEGGDSPGCAPSMLAE